LCSTPIELYQIGYLEPNQKALPKPSYRKNASSASSLSKQFKWRRCCVLNPLIKSQYSLGGKFEVVLDDGGIFFLGFRGGCHLDLANACGPVMVQRSTSCKLLMSSAYASSHPSSSKSESSVIVRGLYESSSSFLTQT